MGKIPPLTYIAQLNGTRPVTCKRGKEGKEERRKKSRRREQREEVGWITKKMEFEFVSLILNAYSLDSPKYFCLEIWFYSKVYSSVKIKGIGTTNNTVLTISE